MAFNKLPEVDDSAKTSEESVLEIRRFFSTKNGFIARAEMPDYGCDLDVELILNDKEASSKKFPIQIKSTSLVKFIKVDGTDYLSKPFKTSRIKYLCQRTPAYGLIIIYDQDSKVSYYEYVEWVVKRINSERGNSEWENLETVNIYIPKTNILDHDSIKSIYQRFKKRFDAEDLLIAKHGENFEIPSFSFPSSENNKSGVKELSASELLKKYGLLFINSSQILILYKLLAEVPLQETLGSKELIFIASVVYGEMGKCIEAELYLAKASQILDQYDEAEKEILQFIKIKVDFLLGNRDMEAFFEDIKKMTAVSANKYNALQLKINLLYYEIIFKIEKREYSISLERNILEIFTLIDEAEIDEDKKMLLIVFHAENFQMYISSWMLHWVTKLRAKEALNIYVPETTKMGMFLKLNELIQIATKQVLRAKEFAIKEKNKLVQAHASYALARFFLIKEFHFLLLSYKDEKTNIEEEFKLLFLHSVHAHNLFLELGLLRDARLALICSYDLNRLAKLYYNITVLEESVSEATMLNNLQASEIEMGLKTSYESIVDKAFTDFRKKKRESNTEKLVNLSDEEIFKLAETIAEAYEIPSERAGNIANELKSFKYFSLYGNGQGYEVLTDLRHHNSKATLYAGPTSYIIKSKLSGMQSLPSTNLKTLIEEFGALK